ncbi:MAG: hypothetical protein LBP53_08935 [Candidatus Peribacteria bacterium]|nr:hypothetical protein [Candidatus Peribacteria bacterium]
MGSSNKEFTAENPFTYEERKQMIEISSHHLLQSLQVEVFPVPDIGDNQRRRDYILKELPEFQYVISGNVRVQEIFK